MPALIENVRLLWARFWYRQRPPHDLAFWRIIFFSLLLSVTSSTDFSALASVSRDFWQPVPLFRVLHIPLLNEGATFVLATVWRVSLFASLIGFGTRISTK